LAAFGFSLLGCASASAAPPAITGTTFSHLTQTSALLEAQVNPKGKEAEVRFEYGPSDCSANPCTQTPIETLPKGESPVPVSAEIEELTPATTYHFRLVAKNGETTNGPDRTLRTFAPPPVFGPCENEAIRAKTHSAALPECRAYEQASPTNKDGGDVTGAVGVVKAAPDGGAISFGSASGLPGGVGAQSLSVFLAARGGASWSTQGLLPPESEGQRARILGLTPDLSEVFSAVTKLGHPRTKALLGRPVSADPQNWNAIGPYVPNGEYAYAGEGGGVVAIESSARLGNAPPEAEGNPNVYVYDKTGETLGLASVSNEGKAPAKGAFAGPYDWVKGTDKTTLAEGGAALGYYTQPNHAIAADGSGIYFTEAGTGRLFLRRNPTAPQSKLEAGKCSEPTKACTIEVSASQRGEPDPAGQRPATFMAASEDGSKAFFTSSQKLTDNANTGPEQPPAAIVRSKLDGSEVEEFLKAHRGVGVAVDSKYIYWADPAEGTIGRAKLDGSEPEDSFIAPGEVEVIEEEEVEVENPKVPGELETVIEHLTKPSKPRWVAVDSEHVYWSNAPAEKDGQGTIGRAKLDGSEVKPEFIKGKVETGPEEFEAQVSNPQGIAVNATHVYWVNAGDSKPTRTIGRAEIDGGEVEARFHELDPGHIGQGLALIPTQIYWTENDQNDDAFVRRIDLDGSNERFMLLSENEKIQVRGIAIDATNVYWAEQKKEAIGRIPLSDFPEFGTCEKVPSCKTEFIKAKGALNGLAVDSEHLYWSSNGESEPNPGNDLYRYDAETQELKDIAPDSKDKDGAEVQGVLGVSADGSRAYFAANGDLDEGGPATAGNCHGPLASAGGKCNLYLWEEGQPLRFVARLDAGGQSGDGANWAPTPTGIFPDFSFQKTSRSTPNGETLLFRSQEQLSEYENEGEPELYLYRAEGGGQLLCVSCDPSNAPAGGARLSTIVPTFITPPTLQSSLARNLSENGNRVFFETTDALVGEDTNGEGGCPTVGSAVQKFPACLDVYEWEAKGEGSCESEGEDGGCLYLISTGKSKEPSLFGDASASGEDVFFFTRERLVGQDEDELFDVYDARVEGGLAAQNEVPLPPCESVEACHGPAQAPPGEESAASAGFVGPGNPAPKRAKARKHRKRHHKHAKQRRAPR
jgi:sugar lactone lactonase YvrE